MSLTRVLAFLGLWFVLVGGVQAAAPTGGITVTPAFQEVTVESTQTSTSLQVTVTNHTAATVTLQLSAVDFGALDESGGVAFLGLGEEVIERKYGLASWFALAKDRLTLAPGQSETINATIDNRQSLSPGGHYGAVVFQPVAPATPAGGPQLQINQAQASLVFAKKTGGETNALELVEYGYQTGLWRLPGQIGLRFHNPGNVHVTPYGLVEIIDPLGRVVSQTAINPESSIILPETYRLLPTKLTGSSWAIWPGRYEVKVSYRFNEQADFQTKHSYFYSLGIIGTLAPIGLLGWGSAWLIRRRTASRGAKHGTAGKGAAIKHRRKQR